MNRFFTLLGLLFAVVGVGAAVPQAHFSYFSYTGNDARFSRQLDAGRQYRNPILAGFYPDPSVCRVGSKYYLVNSTFGYFPGVPLFESDDLVHWQQLGSVLDRPSQLPLQGQGVSGGIFAPDISYCAKNKTFYMVTTNVGTGNFYVKTKDPKQGWSEPVMLPQVDGIDPSFCFLADGTAYLVHNAPVDGQPAYEGQRAIRLLKFDIKGDSIVTRGTPGGRGWWEIVRGGTHVEEKPVWIEGPHLYRIGRYFYLMCAEGGTGDWHSEVVFRARATSDLTRPESWEECPGNPILTQRDLPAHALEAAEDGRRAADVVTSTGHADLVQARDGSWWAVFLGCRPYEGTCYNTGRDTYLLPVQWTDGWPVILPKGQRVPAVAEKPGLAAAGADPSATLTGNFTYTDRFDSPGLHPRWLFLRNAETARYSWGDGLTIEPSQATVSQTAAPSALFCRQQHATFVAETEVDFAPQSEDELAGLVLFQNERHHMVFGLTRLGGATVLVVRRTEGQELTVAHVPVPDGQPVSLRVEGNGAHCSFLYSLGGEWQPLALGVDAAHLSTSRAGGFVGTCIGLYATCGGR